MRKINKIIATLFLVAVFGTVALNPITAFADEQQMEFSHIMKNINWRMT